MTEFNENVRETIKKIKENLFSDTFYPALLIYEILGIDDPTDEELEQVKKLTDHIGTVFDESIRDEINYIFRNREEEE